MKNQKSHILFTVFIFILFLGCEKWTEHEKFQRPDWLPGKLYTTVSVQENLTLFTECLRLSGLDTILDVSGSWSVFAPTDEAMKTYLSANNYSSVSDIPADELEKISEFHVIQNPWTYEQLQSLTAFGWRTVDNSNRYSYAYKRQTMFKNPNEKYWFIKDDKDYRIVLDSTVSANYKKVYEDSRKYVPIFYDQYMTVNGITSDDFDFYFDRPYESGNVYYAGAKIIEYDIFAENGFIHVVDRVVNPMLNAKERLEKELPGESYKQFLQLVYWYYPSFEVNKSATENQPAYKLGGQYDTLWDLNYAKLEFDIHYEITGNFNSNLVNHNGMFAPTDGGFKDFMDGVLTANSGFPHWRDYKSLPIDVVDIIVKPHFTSFPLYPSTSMYHEIFNASGLGQNEGDIIRKEFGSNCTFIGIDSYIPNKVFTSVTGPVFCRPNFSFFRLAMQYSDTYEVIAEHPGELYFFPIPDYALKVDSSMVVNWIDRDENIYNFIEYNRNKHMFESLGQSTIRYRILNHVGTSVPNGSAEKEFIQTLGGYFVTWNHTNNTISGTYPSIKNTTGEVVTNTPVELEEPADNGKVWNVQYWFNFRSQNMKSALAQNTEFFRLLNKAGLIQDGSPDILFINKNEKYTIFVPSDLALAKFQADTLGIPELRKLLMHHFVQGEMIFTDNKKASGKYMTTNGDGLNIHTGPDIIEIADEKGNIYVSIPEEDNTTNIMISNESAVYSVIHKIDKVLLY